jgi:hypothetical protein
MIPNDWLKELMLITDAHAISEWERVKLELSDAVSKEYLKSGNFDRFKASWDGFISQMQPADELWSFESPPDSWASFAGHAGIAIVRDRKPIHIYTTRRS